MGIIDLSVSRMLIGHDLRRTGDPLRGTVFVEGNLVSWKSKKQSVVSRSSAKSEYRVMAQSVSEIMWLHHLLINVGVKTPVPAKNSGVTTRLPFILSLIGYSKNELSILR